MVVVMLCGSGHAECDSTRDERASSLTSASHDELLVLVLVLLL